jgi:hypothetical protein
MKQRSLVVDRFGVWLRVYLGGTAWLRRLVFWNTGMSRGVTLRFGEDKGGDHANCLGVQWRRSRRAAPSTEPAPMPEELCPTQQMRDLPTRTPSFTATATTSPSSTGGRPGVQAGYATAPSTPRLRPPRRRHEHTGRLWVLWS